MGCEGKLDLDRAALTQPVRRRLGSQHAEVVNWRTEAVHGGLMGAGVYRVSGTALVRTGESHWSLIIKRVRAGRGWGDWRREGLAFATGLLDRLPGCLAAPRCFGVEARGQDEMYLWLEEILGRSGDEWPAERYVLGARHLGQFNGAYLAGARLPSAGWLMRGMVRRWTVHLAPSVRQLRDELGRSHQLLRRGWPPDVAKPLFRLWAQREPLISALEGLPQTLCHHDANSRNLISRESTEGHQETVALDWALVGIGPLGYDIVPLCGELLPSFRFAVDEARELVEEIFQGYLKGLADAGWRGREELVRFGFTAALALRYGVCGGPANLSDLVDESRHSVPQGRWGRPLEAIMGRWAECARLMLALGEEARGLLARVSPDSAG